MRKTWMGRYVGGTETTVKKISVLQQDNTTLISNSRRIEHHC